MPGMKNLLESNERFVYKILLPVGHQSIFLPPEHYANIRCVMNRRVEISIVADVGLKMHRRISLINQCSEENI